MRRLGQPAILRSAAIAALLTALACCPRLVLWQARPYPLWYVASVVFLGAIVLWAFVFAWHTPYTGRPVFSFKLEFEPLLAATLAGIGAGLILRCLLDPRLRLETPEDYPKNAVEWMAMTLFALGFSQLFLVFAPFAWLTRLFQNTRIAAVLTVAFGVVVLAIKATSSPAPYPSALLAALVLARIVIGSLALAFYLRGGVLLAWWLGFLIEARHLLEWI